MKIFASGALIPCIIDILKNQIHMVRGGPGSYRLRMNKSEIEAEIHTLRDGGLLMQASIQFYLQYSYDLGFADVVH